MSKSLPLLMGVGVIAALAVAAIVPSLRLPVLGLLLAVAVFTPRGSSWRWAAAAGVPVAIILSWGSLLGAYDAAAVTCADVASPLAWSRVAEAALVIVVILALARWLGTDLAALGLRRPQRPELVLGVVAIFLIPIPSLYVGAILAEPFFGPMRMDLAQPMALVPALTLAIANGTMEELAYRGALMSWLSRAAGPVVGLVGQALIFGLAHTGNDYTGSAIPVVLAIMATGLVAGLIVRRTGSLWIPIFVHIAFDVPLYYAAACRLS